MPTPQTQSATGLSVADLLKWRYLALPSVGHLTWHKPGGLTTLRLQDAAKLSAAVVSNVLPKDARTCDNCFPAWGNDAPTVNDERPE